MPPLTAWPCIQAAHTCSICIERHAHSPCRSKSPPAARSPSKGARPEPRTLELLRSTTPPCHQMIL
eukprot:6847013-Prymnesium_polylepis.1